jgi:hypothetical protein
MKYCVQCGGEVPFSTYLRAAFSNGAFVCGVCSARYSSVALKISPMVVLFISIIVVKQVLFLFENIFVGTVVAIIATLSFLLFVLYYLYSRALLSRQELNKFFVTKDVNGPKNNQNDGVTDLRNSD